MLWAANWPHPGSPLDAKPEEAECLDVLLDWAPGRRPARIRLSTADRIWSATVRPKRAIHAFGIGPLLRIRPSPMAGQSIALMLRLTGVGLAMLSLTGQRA